MAQFTFERARNPSLQSVIFIVLFSAFLLFLYITLYAFGHLPLERRANQEKAKDG